MPISTEDYARRHHHHRRVARASYADHGRVPPRRAHGRRRQGVARCPRRDDARASPTTPTFRPPPRGIPADRLAAFYVALDALRAASSRPSSRASRAPSRCSQALLASCRRGSPATRRRHPTTSRCRSTSSGPRRSPVPAVRETDLATRFPAGTLLLSRDARRRGDRPPCARAAADAGPPRTTRRTSTGSSRSSACRSRTLLDSVQDAASGVSFADGVVQGGIVATLSDPAAAQQRVTALLTLVRAIASQDDAPISVDQKEVDGVHRDHRHAHRRAEDLPASICPSTPAVSIAVVERSAVPRARRLRRRRAHPGPADVARDRHPVHERAARARARPTAGLLYVDLAGAPSRGG